MSEAATTELLTNPVHEYTHGSSRLVLPLAGAQDGTRLHQGTCVLFPSSDFLQATGLLPRSIFTHIWVSEVHPLSRRFLVAPRFSELPG